jgi:putative restriction endonuclease
MRVQFVVALTDDQREITPGSVAERALRRYVVGQTRRRLHQPVFAGQVMLACTTRCAVGDLHHRELLDAARIIPDTAPGGDPVVPNGLALCKIHHAAYDANVLGIRPDYVVQNRDRLLAEIDGPMLRHGFQAHHDRSLMRILTRKADRPDPGRLARRFDQFRAA